MALRMAENVSTMGTRAAAHRDSVSAAPKPSRAARLVLLRNASAGRGADFRMTEGMLEGLRNCTREGGGTEQGQGLGERQEWGRNCGSGEQYQAYPDPLPAHASAPSRRHVTLQMTSTGTAGCRPSY